MKTSKVAARIVSRPMIMNNILIEKVLYKYAAIGDIITTTVGYIDEETAYPCCSKPTGIKSGNQA